MRKQSTPIYNIFTPVKIFFALLLVTLIFFAPIVNSERVDAPTEPATLQEVYPALKPFASSADACPWACIKCTSWDQNAWPRTCLTYECMDASGDCGGSGGGGGGYQPPTISHVLTCSNTGNNGWCIGTLNLDLTASDPQGQTLVISGTVNGVAFACPSGQTTCSIPLPEAAGTATYKVDSATGLSASGSTSYQLDVTTPQIDGSINGSSGNSGWYTSQTSVSALASDALSGLASFEVNADNAGWASYSDTTFTDGMHTIQFRAIDNAGNVTETALQSVNVDTTAPTLNLATTGTMGQNSWYVSAVTLTPTASDATSGLYSLEVTTDGNTWSSVSAPLILTDGVYTVQFRATDNAGNISQTPSQQVKIDATTPSLSLNVSGTRGQNDWFISSTTVTPNASDAGSGINKTEAKIDNGTWSIVNSSASFVDGVHTYQYKVTDNAGNVTETPSITMMVDTVPPAIAMSDDTLALGDTLMYDLEDSLSGLWITRAVIEDEGEKYKKLVWVEEITGKKSNNNAIRWDGVFADGTKAAPGQYFITLKVSDQAGNETMQTAIVEVTAFNSILPIPVFTPPTSLTPNPSPSERGEPVLEFGGANNGTVGTETAVTNGETVFASVSLQAGGTSSFTAGNQSSNVPNTNSNILWGAAAATMLGVTLAEWQKKREEEEAARLAALQNSGGGEEEEEPSKKKTPGQIAYEKMMQQKRIVGESQALLNQNRAREQAMQDYRAGERNAVAIAQSYQAQKAMEAQRAGELNAVAIAEEYKTQEQAKQNAVSTARWAGVASVAQGKQEEQKSGNWLSNLWNAGVSAVGSVLSLGNVGGGKPLAMPVTLDGTPPPTPLPDGFELGKSPYHDLFSDLYSVNNFRLNIKDDDPRQYGNLSMFLEPGYSVRHTNLCGQIVVSTLTNIPLKSVLLEYAETPLGAERLKNNTPTKPGEISLLFNNLGWSASVKGLDGNYWYGDEPSPSEINAYLANGNEVVALVKIDSNNYHGALRPNGKTGHWVSIQDIDVQSEKVTIYNPYRDQEQIYEWEDFKEAWQDEGSHTVYNYAAIIASPPASAVIPTSTPIFTSTPAPTNTVTPTMTSEPTATTVPETQQVREQTSFVEDIKQFFEWLFGGNK